VQSPKVDVQLQFFQYNSLLTYETLLFNLKQMLCCKTNEAVLTMPVAPIEPVKDPVKEESPVQETATETGSVADEEAEKSATEKGYKCCGIY
jgi:hypothetical protein